MDQGDYGGVMPDDYDAGDYDTDDRVFCKDCHDWSWPDSGDVKLCDRCEEYF